MLEALFGHRQADQAASELGHEVDGFGRDFFGGEGEVAFVLAIFVVDHHDHAAGADFLNCIGDVGEGVLGTHIVAILAEVITAEQKPLTAEIAKATRRTKNEEEISLRAPRTLASAAFKGFFAPRETTRRFLRFSRI